MFCKRWAPHVRVNCICPGTICAWSETQGEGDRYSTDMAFHTSRSLDASVHPKTNGANTVCISNEVPHFDFWSDFADDGANIKQMRNI
jgi:NAD(P)-dependent dehydrogenase (short-subunit alcohol dehydrogenase family)